MGITVQWSDAAQTIIYAHITNPWGWTDAHNAREQVRALASAREIPLRFVVEIAFDVSLAPGGLPQNTKASVALHDEVNFEQVVYILLNPALVPIWEAALETYGTHLERYVIVTTRAEGAEWLQR